MTDLATIATQSPLRNAAAAVYNAVVRLGLINIETIIPLGKNDWFGGTIRGAFMSMATQIHGVMEDMNHAAAKIDELDATLNAYFAHIEDWAGQVNAFAAGVPGQIEAKAQELRTDATTKVQELRDRVDTQVTHLSGVITNVYDAIPGMIDAKVQELRDRVDTQVTHLSGVITNVHDAFNVRVGGLEQFNLDLGPKIKDLQNFDAKLAEMIAGSNGRTTELENKLPKTTEALNKRVDEANQAATEKANAALAAANENITTVRTELEDRLRIETQLTSDLKRRMDRMELQIDKVAPLLAKIPKFPGGG
jgi:ABC-type transporter Mla subunit MlaD